MASPRRRTDARESTTPDRRAVATVRRQALAPRQALSAKRSRSTTSCTRALAGTSRPRSTCRRRCSRSSAAPTASRKRWRAKSGRSRSARGCRRSSSRTAACAFAIRRADGVSHQAEGAFCISTLPLTILRDVSLDAAPEFRAAVAAVNYSSAGKIGLQFARRFWEEDDGIFGGITRTDQEITQILYPSTGYLSRKGVSSATTRPAPSPVRWAIWRQRNDCSGRSSRDR